MRRARRLTKNQRTTMHVLVGAVIVLLIIVIGFSYLPESTFQLANESRLPKWITIPSGLDRNDVSISMSYYNSPLGGSAKFTLRDSKQRVLEKVNGRLKCRYPIELTNSLSGLAPDYPSYEEITVNGVTEIIEHKRSEPIFLCNG